MSAGQLLLSSEMMEPAVSLKYRERSRTSDLCAVLVLFGLTASVLFVGLYDLVGDSVEPGQLGCLQALFKTSSNDAPLSKKARTESESTLLFMALVSSCASAVPFTFAFCPVVLSLLPSSRITLRRRSIKFPDRFKRGLNGQLSRMWSDLESVMDCQSQDVESKDHCLAEFKFRSGGKIVLDLSSMSESDQMTFMSAIDELAADCTVSARLWALKGSSQASGPENRRLSYTRFWEESLSSSLRSTVFVPLSGGDSLQDGRLRIVRQLASTPWSATYLARVDERQLVVVKESVVPGDSAAAAKAMEQFDRECQILSTLNHPRIAKVYDHFVESGRRYLVLQYFAGLDLRELLLRRGELPEGDVIRAGVEICSALSYLHRHDPVVIHRDVTPDNIVMGDDQTVRLIDFGASKFFFANATGTLVGKQSYLAPEQLRGVPDTRSDIYALGATMYSLLTGEEPVPLGQCAPVGRNRPISAALTELVFQMTSFEAHLRPASVDEVQQRLKQILSSCLEQSSAPAANLALGSSLLRTGERA